MVDNTYDKLTLNEFCDIFKNNYINKLHEKMEHQIKVEIYYRPITSKSGDTVGVLEIFKQTYMDCGDTEEFVNQIFTNGDDNLETMCCELGYRN